MFANFDPLLFDDPEFKEDSVREVIISPILSRLGYSPSGENRVVRSKVLKHPFIYAGTRKLPIRLIPDYTLISGDRVVLVLDAKQPRIDMLGQESVQQAYSYAIHPEIKSEHFALCNGKRIAVYSVDQSDPILVLDYQDFESAWDDIVRFLSPPMLREPSLRKFAPDFGCALARLGLKEGAIVTLLPASFNLVARLDDNMMTASANIDFSERPHCISLDFENDFLPIILGCLPDELSEAFSNALRKAPFQAAAELAVETDLHAILGPEIEGDAENFRPLVIKEIISSRFRPFPLENRATDIPPHIFRLRDAFALRE